MKSDFTKPWEEQNDLPPEIRGAVICAQGKLTPDYTYIQRLRETNELLAQKNDGGGSSQGI